MSRWTSYVAVGDSFTEGLDDEIVDGRHRGWADRFAQLLAAETEGELRYANLAIRGNRLESIVTSQVPQALGLGPDLISFAGGVNDALRPKFDVQQAAGLLESGIAKARSQGADVLLVSFGQPSGRSKALGLIERRLTEYREHLLRIGHDHGCILMDLWDESEFDDSRFWAPDRLHLNAMGHERIAWAAMEALGFPTPDWRAALPAQDVHGRLVQLRADLEWTVQYLGPWIGRRLTGRSSGDGVTPKRPELNAVPVPEQALEQ